MISCKSILFNAGIVTPARCHNNNNVISAATPFYNYNTNHYFFSRSSHYNKHSFTLNKKKKKKSANYYGNPLRCACSLVLPLLPFPLEQVCFLFILRAHLSTLRIEPELSEYPLDYNAIQGSVLTGLCFDFRYLFRRKLRRFICMKQDIYNFSKRYIYLFIYLMISSL